MKRSRIILLLNAVIILIAAWLWLMPNFNLSDPEIEAIAAYLGTLTDADN